MMMGHEIAMEIRRAGEEGKSSRLSCRWVPWACTAGRYIFLNEWDVDCSHVYGFNMDEWSDAGDARLISQTRARSHAR